MKQQQQLYNCSIAKIRKAPQKRTLEGAVKMFKERGS